MNPNKVGYDGNVGVSGGVDMIVMIDFVGEMEGEEGEKCGDEGDEPNVGLVWFCFLFYFFVGGIWRFWNVI